MTGKIWVGGVSDSTQKKIAQKMVIIAKRTLSASYKVSCMKWKKNKFTDDDWQNWTGEFHIQPERNPKSTNLPTEFCTYIDIY